MVEELTLKKKQVMTINQIKDQDIVSCIENSVEDKQYWIDKQQVAEQLDTSIEAIQKLIQESSTIVINAKGELTTRKLYNQKTPFINKLLNSIKNRID